MMSHFKIGTNELPIVLKDPFYKDFIYSISMTLIQENNGFRCYGNIQFSRGNTSGTQYFDGADFIDVSSQITIFISQLKQQNNEESRD